MERKKSGVQQCQKCLKYGHYTFECPNPRAYVYRPSETMLHDNPELRKHLTEDKAPKRPKLRDDFKRVRQVTRDSSSDDEFKSQSSRSSSSASSSSGSSSSGSSNNSSKSEGEAKSVDKPIVTRLTNKELRALKDAKAKERVKDRERSRHKDRRSGKDEKHRDRRDRREKDDKPRRKHSSSSRDKKNKKDKDEDSK